MDRVCSVEGAKSCDNNVLQTCDLTNNIIHTKDCGPDFCDAAAGACVPRVCSVSEGQKCSANAIVICNERNNTYDVMQDCGADFCQTPTDASPNPTCVPRVCTTHGKKQCENNNIVVCNTSDNSLTLDTLCASNASCEEKTEGPVCVPCSEFVGADMLGHVGCEFFAFEHELYSKQPATKLVVSNSDASNTAYVTISAYVTDDAAALSSTTHELAPLSSSVINISPLSSNIVREASSLTKRAIVVSSSKPITVSLHSKQGAVADETLILPLRNLATKYTVSSIPIEELQSVLILATSDDTSIQYHTKTALVAGTGLTLPAANTTGTFTLNKYQALGLVVPRAQDPSGSTIEANKPVAVYSVMGSVRIPEPVPYYDAAFEQMLPDSYLGKQHIVLPQYIKHLNAYKETYISIFAPTGAAVTLSAPYNRTVNIAAGTSLHIETLTDEAQPPVRIPSITPLLIQSDKPISVAQYFTASKHNVFGTPSTDPANIVSTPFSQAAEIADPSMAYIVPTDLFTNNKLYFYAQEDWADNFVMLIAPSDAVVSLYYDNVKHSDVIFPAYQVLGDFKFAYVPIEKTRFGHFESDKAIGAYYYGYTTQNVTSCLRPLGIASK